MNDKFQGDQNFHTRIRARRAGLPGIIPKATIVVPRAERRMAHGKGRQATEQATVSFRCHRREQSSNSTTDVTSHVAHRLGGETDTRTRARAQKWRVKNRAIHSAF